MRRWSVILTNGVKSIGLKDSHTGIILLFRDSHACEYSTWALYNIKSSHLLAYINEIKEPENIECALGKISRNPHSKETDLNSWSCYLRIFKEGTIKLKAGYYRGVYFVNGIDGKRLVDPHCGITKPPMTWANKFLREYKP